MYIVYVYNTKKKFTDVTVLGPTGNRTPISGIKNRCAKPLHHRTMAHPDGVEPPTSRLTVERSNQTELWVNILGHSRI